MFASAACELQRRADAHGLRRRGGLIAGRRPEVVKISRSPWSIQADVLWLQAVQQWRFVAGFPATATAAQSQSPLFCWTVLFTTIPNCLQLVWTRRPAIILHRMPPPGHGHVPQLVTCGWPSYNVPKRLGVQTLNCLWFGTVA